MQSHFKFIILLALLQGSCLVMGAMRLRATGFKCTIVDHSLMGNLTCSMSDEEEPRLSGGGQLTASIPDVQIRYRAVSLKRGKEEDFYKGEFDLCNALDSKFVVGMIMENVKRFGKLPTKCPVPAYTEYYVKDFALDKNIIPAFLPAQKGYVQIEILTGKNVLFEMVIDGICESY